MAVPAADIAAEVAALRAQRDELRAEREAADTARAAAELKRIQDLADKDAADKAAALLVERVQLAAEVERLRAARAETLATAVVEDASEVERLRQVREGEVGAHVKDVAAVQTEQARLDLAHTAGQDRRLDEINGSQERTAKSMADVQMQLSTIQKGIDETAAVAKALADKGASAKLMIGLATGIILPLLALIIAVIQGLH